MIRWNVPLNRCADKSAWLKKVTYTGSVRGLMAPDKSFSEAPGLRTCNCKHLCAVICGKVLLENLVAARADGPGNAPRRASPVLRNRVPVEDQVKSLNSQCTPEFSPENLAPLTYQQQDQSDAMMNCHFWTLPVRHAVCTCAHLVASY